MVLVLVLAVRAEHAGTRAGIGARAPLARQVGVGQQRARHADEVRAPLAQDGFRLLEGVDLARGDHGDGEAGRAHRRADAVRQVRVRGHGVVPRARDAPSAAVPGIGIHRFAHRRLLRVLELAAAGDGEHVQARARQLHRDLLRVLERVAAHGAVLAQDVLRTQEPAAQDEVRPRLLAHRTHHFQRQAHAVGKAAAVGVAASVGDGEERGHGVGVREVELHAVEAARARAAGGGGEPAGDAADLGQVEVLDGLAVPVEEVALLAGGEIAGMVALELGVAQREHGVGQRAAVHHRFHEHARRLARGDLEEVDDLRHHQRGAGRAHLVEERPEAGHEAVMAEPQQWTAGHVADAGGLQHDHPGSAHGVAEVDVVDVARDEAILGAAPGHHGREPDPVGQDLARAPEREGLEEARVRARAGGLGQPSSSSSSPSPAGEASASAPSDISSSMPWSATRRWRASKPRRSGGAPSR